ncbi:MAG: hypothetical protein H9Q65_02555 [Spiroplasma ixodetis]|nr:hypothetical protein [Spiroplasma ixodetis]MBP1526959.1 hypothetical protein [Spiroplasma ixodetis]MBP1528119.1 hypothetical protein [Spiroplasma ixodetis]
MKSLLSMLAVSTLVGTSGSSLQPMFAQKIVNTGFKSNQLNNKEINIENENDINPFTPKKLISGIPNNVAIRIVNVASDGTVYVWTETGIMFIMVNLDVMILKEKLLKKQLMK